MQLLWFWCDIQCRSGGQWGSDAGHTAHASLGRDATMIQLEFQVTWTQFPIWREKNFKIFSFGRWEKKADMTHRTCKFGKGCNKIWSQFPISNKKKLWNNSFERWAKKRAHASLGKGRNKTGSNLNPISSLRKKTHFKITVRGSLLGGTNDCEFILAGN